MNNPTDKCIECEDSGRIYTGSIIENTDGFETCPTCKGTGEGETNIEGKLENSGLIDYDIAGAGHVYSMDKLEKWIENEIAHERQRALQETREEIVGMIETIPTHLDEGQGAVGRYGNKVIKAIKNLK